MADVECFVSGVLATVLRVSRFVGLAPLSFRRDGAGWRVRLSTGFTVYGNTVITAINAVNVFIIVKMFQSESVGQEFAFEKWTNTSFFVWIMNYFLLLALTSVAGYGARGRMKTMIACFNYLQKINYELNIFHWPNWLEKKKKIYCVFAVLATFILSFTDKIHILVNWLKDMVQNGKSNILTLSRFDNLTAASFSFFALNYAILKLQQIQFNFICLHVLYTFKAMNESLRALILDILENSTTSVLLPHYANRHNITIAMIRDTMQFYEKPNDKVFDFGRVSSTEIKPEELAEAHVEKVRSLASVYMALCDVVRELDQSNGLMMLLMLGFYFYQLVEMLFYFLFNTFRYIKTYEENTAVFGYAMTEMGWCLWLAAGIVLLVEPCHMTHMEIEKTRTLVSHLMCCTESAYEPLAVELEVFYKHLELNQPSYSALGVTRITRALLAAIFGSITTYLIILIDI